MQESSLDNYESFLSEIDPVLAIRMSPLLSYFKTEVTDIIINKPKEVVVHYHNNRKEFFHNPAISQEWLIAFATRFATRSGQEFSNKTPSLSFKLPGSHRVQIISGSNVIGKFCVAIRLSRGVSFTLDDFSMDEKVQAEVIQAVRNRKTLLISGGTGCGKTSMLNTLIPFINENERLVSIEGVQELIVPHKDKTMLVYSENGTSASGINVRSLLNATLRLNPDRILFGEILYANAFTFLKSTNTGHEGCMATIHANSPEGALSALLEYIMTDPEVDLSESGMQILDKQLRRNIYGVLQIQKEKDVHGEETGKVLSQFKRLNESENSKETSNLHVIQ
jgi:type IV secretory pathway ATPase VirB11/archaellum biosynthesis ATPase